MSRIMPLKWAYGVTTCLMRRETLLPRTLESLKNAGFDKPRLFVDGDADIAWWSARYPHLEITLRYPTIRTFGNWVLSLAELYIRNGEYDRYAIFQDDFVTYKNLRQYLDKCEYKDNTYWNCYTFPANQDLCKDGKTGWYMSNQFGRGAVALIFNRKAVVDLLSSEHMAKRPQDPTRGHQAVDGGIVTGLVKKGYTELVHNPSLVQHTGLRSSMGHKKHKLAVSFRDETYDALNLLGETTV